MKQAVAFTFAVLVTLRLAVAIFHASEALPRRLVNVRSRSAFNHQPSLSIQQASLSLFQHRAIATIGAGRREDVGLGGSIEWSGVLHLATARSIELSEVLGLATARSIELSEVGVAGPLDLLLAGDCC